MNKQALQNLNKPPEKLKALIELVNGFPSDTEQLRLMHPQVLRKEAEFKLVADDLVNDRAFVDLIEEKASYFSPKARNYIFMGFWDGGKSFKGDIEFIKEGGVVQRYEQLWDAYLTLRSIARRPDKESKPRIWILHTLYAAPVFLEIDEQGMLRDVKSLFFQAIENENVEARRIRECPICKRIFWAGRISQKCCSTQCANTFRVHRHRYRTDEEKAEYELRRIRREAKRNKKPQENPQSTKKGK